MHFLEMFIACAERPACNRKKGLQGKSKPKLRLINTHDSISLKARIEIFRKRGGVFSLSIAQTLKRNEERLTR